MESRSTKISFKRDGEKPYCTLYVSVAMVLIFLLWQSYLYRANFGKMMTYDYFMYTVYWQCQIRDSRKAFIIILLFLTFMKNTRRDRASNVWLFYKDYWHGHQILNSYLSLTLEALPLYSIQWTNHLLTL